MSDFKLQRIEITRNRNYRDGEWTETYKGSVKLSGDHGSIEVVLTDKEVREVVRVCASTLVSVAEDAAVRMRASVFEAISESAPKEDDHADLP